MKEHSFQFRRTGIPFDYNQNTAECYSAIYFPQVLHSCFVFSMKCMQERDACAKDVVWSAVETPNYLTYSFSCFTSSFTECSSS